MKTRGVVTCALCGILALMMVACGPSTRGAAQERIIIRAEDGMPPTRAAGTPEPLPTLFAPQGAYPEPAMTPTPTGTPAAYP